MCGFTESMKTLMGMGEWMDVGEDGMGDGWRLYVKFC